MIFDRLLIILMFLVPCYIIISFFVMIMGPRFRNSNTRKKRAYGEVKEVKELQGAKKVIVEFKVDGKVYRCVDPSYGYVVMEGNHIEVFYDTNDPREASLGRILQGDLDTITCTKCVGPVNIKEPVCPYCGFLLTPELYNSNVHDKPIKDVKRIFVALKRFLPVFLVFFLTIEFMIVTVSLVEKDYVSFSNAIIFFLVTLIIAVIYHIKNAYVYDDTTTGEVVYVHEQTLSNDDVRNWAVVAEFEVRGKKYRSVNSCSLVCYNECEEVIVKYNSVDPRRSDFNKFK